MVNEQDIMSVEYTEFDNGCPALCFCNDIIIPITNKTMAKSYVNYMRNDMRFKILNFKIQDLMITYLSQDITSLQARINGKFEFMGLVNSEDMLFHMAQVVDKLEEGEEE